ncbi:MAG: hypothetical protein ACMXX7_02470 [Candidatus Woesearchaeota archaeon]
MTEKNNYEIIKYLQAKNFELEQLNQKYQDIIEYKNIGIKVRNKLICLGTLTSLVLGGISGCYYGYLNGVQDKKQIQQQETRINPNLQYTSYKDKCIDDLILEKEEL